MRFKLPELRIGLMLEWVDRLYDWVRAFVGGRVEVEDTPSLIVAPQSDRSSGMIEQAVSRSTPST
jgi:hypothetical protein